MNNPEEQETKKDEPYQQHQKTGCENHDSLSRDCSLNISWFLTWNKVLHVVHIN